MAELSVVPSVSSEMRADCVAVLENALERARAEEAIGVSIVMLEPDCEYLHLVTDNHLNNVQLIGAMQLALAATVEQTKGS